MTVQYSEEDIMFGYDVSDIDNTTVFFRFEPARQVIAKLVGHFGLETIREAVEACESWENEDLPHVEVTREALDNIADHVINIILEKNADYNNAWQRDAIPGVMSRLKDKLCRIEVLADGRQALVAGEKLEDTLVDAIGYSMLGLLYLEALKGFNLE